MVKFKQSGKGTFSKRRIKFKNEIKNYLNDVYKKMFSSKFASYSWNCLNSGLRQS